jgi:acetyl-CoA synthetase/medium-chain acyl-CoA synthetase
VHADQPEFDPHAPPRQFNFAAHVVDWWAKKRPDAPALWHVDAATGAQQRFTFVHLARLSRQAATLLRDSGVQRGEPVLLMLPRVPEWWIAMLGLIRLGAVPVPATLLLTERDVAYRLDCAKIRTAITNEEGLLKLGNFEGRRILAETAAAIRKPVFVAGADNQPSRASAHFNHGLENARARFRHERIPSNDPSILYFTSATTGEPKMVLHTQISYGLGHRLTGEHWLDLRPDDVHWNISDLGWGKAAWSSFYGPWHMGACVFGLNAPGKFHPAQTLDTLAEFPITTWCAPPTALRLIARQDLARWRFPHLRHCVTAGEPLNPEILHRWRDATGLTLYEGYGQTETVVMTCNSRKAGHPVKPGSMGRAVPGFELGLLNEALEQVPSGEEGEIAVRVKPKRPLGLFREYWLNPEENARKFRGDWYLTGDRAVRDEEGYFWFVGRKDDVIKSSGYRIGPFEVESALIEHNAVLEVAVIGKPDSLRGQIVKACVVLRPGFDASDDLKADLQAHCKRLIAAYKYPREIEFMRELPKTVSGKTRHVELRGR